MVFLLLRVVWRWKLLLDEQEIKNIIEREKNLLEAIVDPVDRKCCGAFIAGLECCLNE